MSDAPGTPRSVRAAFLGCMLAVAVTAPCNPVGILGGWGVVAEVWGPYTADNNHRLDTAVGVAVAVLLYVTPAAVVLVALWGRSVRTRRLGLFAVLGLYIGCVVAFFIALANGPPL